MNKRNLFFIALFCIIPMGLNAQLNKGDYYVISNQNVEPENARRLVIKITSDSAYEYVDNVRRFYTINKADKKIEFPFSKELCVYGTRGDTLEINCQNTIYSGPLIDSISQSEKEAFRRLLIDLDLPYQNEKDSVIKTLDGIATWKNSRTLHLSYHQKSLYQRNDENDNCIIQFENYKISMCDIDNACSLSGITAKNKDLFFKNRMKEHPVAEDFIFILFIDKDVKIKDINTTLKALRKIDNLSEIYFAIQRPDADVFRVSYMTIPKNASLNPQNGNFNNWISQSLSGRYMKGERIMIIDDSFEITD